MYFPALSDLPRRGAPSSLPISVPTSQSLPTTTTIKPTKFLTLNRRAAPTPIPSSPSEPAIPSISSRLFSSLVNRNQPTSPANPIQKSLPSSTATSSLPVLPIREEPLPHLTSSPIPALTPPLPTSTGPTPLKILTLTLLTSSSLALFTLTCFLLWHFLLRPRARRAPTSNSHLLPHTHHTHHATHDPPPTYHYTPSSFPNPPPMEEKSGGMAARLGFKGVGVRLPPALKLNTGGFTLGGKGVKKSVSFPEERVASGTDVDYMRGERTPEAGTVEGMGMGFTSPVTPRRGWGFKADGNGEGGEGGEEEGVGVGVGEWWREARGRFGRF